jgi:endogenous inhibitor of DNA gyrase (YacG/DUF329 family)
MPEKPKAIVEITKEVFKEPLEVIKRVTENIEGVAFTKVIQTYVMENRNINFALERGGNVFFKGKLVWLGNRKDARDGTVFCVDTGSKTESVTPSPENTTKVILDPKKDLIKISTESRVNCAICEKGLEIFDEIATCPACNAKAHKNHLLDWVKMKYNCPVCKTALNISEDNQIYESS